MERQEKGNMEISGSSTRHQTGVPEAQSPSDTDSVKINAASPARTLRQDQTEADNPTARQSEVLYERSETNKRENGSSFNIYWDQIQPAKAQTDSDDESGISILSHQSKISISSHQTKTDNATTQQTKGVQFLEFLKWPCAFLPEVSMPDRKIELGEKVVFTFMVLVIFMVCCQMPLFGIKSSESVDCFYHMRVTIWGSNRGTLMEFGIMPIVESYGILLSLNAFGIINLDDTSYNNALLNGAQRLLAMLLTVVMSVLFIMTGMYGELENIGVAILIGIQLFLAGLIIVLLNDIVKKGYCLGTDISLLIVPNICATIIWKALSPVTVYTIQGAEFEGVFLFLLRSLSIRAFFRQDLPNLVNFFAIVFVFVIVFYLKGFRVQLPMRSTKNKGQHNFHTIDLLYTSITPLFLQSAFVSILYIFSQVLSTRFSENFLITLLGVWAEERSDGSPRSYPIGGLCYYLSPPRTPLQVTQDPVYAVVYTIFMIGSCALFSRIWIDFININAVDVARKLKKKNMIMRGQNEQSMLIELERYIPTAAIVGGLCIGTLSVLSDFLGMIVSGTRVILVSNVIYDYAEIVLKEKKMQEEKNTLLF